MVSRYKGRERHWMSKENRVVPLFSPVPTIDPNSFVSSDFDDKNDNCDQTINDILDNIGDCDETCVASPTAQSIDVLKDKIQVGETF